MKDLNSEWARSQIEAAAEGSLSPGDRARFAEAMAADASLERAVRQAKRVQLDLARMRASRVPPGLWRSLLAIPRTASEPAARPMRRPLIAAGVGAALAAVALTLLLKPTSPSPSTEEQARAVADFELAMSYLQESTEIARTELTTALGGALQRALAGNRDATRDERSRSNTGD